MNEGPTGSRSVVRRMFQMFVAGQRSEFEIARVLNSEGCLTDRGFAWSSRTVHSILTNEKYLGNLSHPLIFHTNEKV